MLSILGGQWSGRRLKALDREGLRPSLGRVKAGIFSILDALEWKRAGEPPTYAGWRCLDLFAGVGGLGLEMLSRGAEHCVFVEKDRRTAQVLRENIHELDCAAHCEVIQEGVEKKGWQKFGPFHLILLDPPYAESDLSELLSVIAQNDILRPGGVVVFEHDPKVKLSAAGPLRLHSTRTLGPAGISVFVRDA
jgi:16S rRNA (guanine(966)-N(2))-methyltransferase RsmD